MGKSIVLDVDCVILDFYAGFERLASEFLDRKIEKKHSRYSLIERYDIKQNELKGIFGYMINRFDDFPLLEGADKAFQSIKNAGYSIHLVTSILPELSEQRLRNLKKYDIIPDSIDCINTESKDAYIRKYNPIAMVDDRIENLYSIADAVPNRILINNGDDQKGFEHMRKHITHESESLSQWVILNPDLIAQEIRRPRMR